MNAIFEEGVALLKQFWTDSDGSFPLGKNAGLNALRRYLSENGLDYSHDAALEWVSKNQDVWNKSKLMSYRRAVYELNDIILNGTVSGDYHYHDTAFDHLSDLWKKYLSNFYSHLRTRMSHRCAREQIEHCTVMMLYMESEGVASPEKITVGTIAHYYDYAESIGDGYICLYSCRYFLEYLSEGGLIPVHLPYMLTAPIQVKGTFFAVSNADRTKISSINAQQSDVRLSPADFMETGRRLADNLEKEFHYDRDALRNNYTAHFQMFFIFICESNADYVPDLADYWVELMGSFTKNHKQTAFARRSAFRVMKIFASTGSYDPSRDGVRQTEPGNISRMQEWGLDLMNSFLDFCRLEGKKDATVEQHKSASISFFLYMQDQGISTPGQITPQLVKDYNSSVASSFPSGKNHYRYSVRQLLLYLFEHSRTGTNLACSLPSQSAKSRKIVDVLDKEQIDMVYAYCSCPNGGLAIRDSAILMCGLLMGLRGIDIVSLRFQDIDFRKQTISITQKKTYRPLVLPMPTAVGNRIYRYVKYARPKSDSRYIFLSTTAPFGKAHKSACGAALKRAIGRGDFHVMRRTFATGLLNTGAGTDRIKDSLGHSTMDTVDRYLSVEEKNMRECCLPLERTVVSDEAKA